MPYTSLSFGSSRFVEEEDGPVPRRRSCTELGECPIQGAPGHRAEATGMVEGNTATPPRRSTGRKGSIEAFQRAYPAQVRWHRPSAESPSDAFMTAINEAADASLPDDVVVVISVERPRGAAPRTGSGVRRIPAQAFRCAWICQTRPDRTLRRTAAGAAPSQSVETTNPRHLYVWWEPLLPAGSASPFGDLRRGLESRLNVTYRDWLQSARRAEPQAAGLGSLRDWGEGERLMMRGGDDLAGACFVDMVQREAMDIDFGLGLLDEWKGVATGAANALTRGALLLAREEMEGECLAYRSTPLRAQGPRRCRLQESAERRPGQVGSLLAKPGARRGGRPRSRARTGPRASRRRSLPRQTWWPGCAI